MKKNYSLEIFIPIEIGFTIVKVFTDVTCTYRSDCNGHLPLNNQRTLSPQNSIKRPVPSPRNSFKIRNNSCSSSQSNCNSIILSRQNSFNSRRTLNSLSSMSAVLKDEVKQNNLMEGTTSPTQVEVGVGAEEEEEDPDAIDETVSKDQYINSTNSQY